jgi:hypothetical protein
VQVLVDYDNVPKDISIKGPRFLADLIQTRLISFSPTSFPGDVRLNIRFYGGWYASAIRSSRANQLLAAIQSQFPMIVQDPKLSRKIILNASLAESLLAVPNHLLVHTFRRRSGVPPLVCNTPSGLNCSNPSCPAGPLSVLINSKGCPIAGCTKGIGDFLSRAEQKLVDTMLVSDMIHLAFSREPMLAVVSSDDDLWPGMLTAMSSGSHIFHITTGYPSTSPMYLGTMNATYQSLSI